jgi:hypothetical protein
MKVPAGTYEDTIIDGTEYSGHAIGEMQSDGITPTVAENVIRNGIESETKGPNGEIRVLHYDSENHISVVTEDGKVITVSRGALKANL